MASAEQIQAAAPYLKAKVCIYSMRHRDCLGFAVNTVMILPDKSFVRITRWWYEFIHVLVMILTKEYFVLRSAYGLLCKFL